MLDIFQTDTGKTTSRRKGSRHCPRSKVFRNRPARERTSTTVHITVRKRIYFRNSIIRTCTDRIASLGKCSIYGIIGRTLCYLRQNMINNETFTRQSFIESYFPTILQQKIIVFRIGLYSIYFITFKGRWQHDLFFPPFQSYTVGPPEPRFHIGIKMCWRYPAVIPTS